jgi:hypothetical protein
MNKWNRIYKFKRNIILSPDGGDDADEDDVV